MSKSTVIRFAELGSASVLKHEEVEVRDPAEEEVRISVRAMGLNRAETLYRQGKYLEQATLPSLIGYEAAGVVDAVGSGVEGISVGDSVSVVPAFSMQEYGVHGEMVLAPSRTVVKHPPELSFVQAAAVWMQYLTAYGALVDIFKLSAQQTVLITAASSSVGIAAVQIAKDAGATVIATTRGEKKREAILAQGADHVIMTDLEDLAERVAQITNGRGFDLAFDPVAGRLLPTLAEAAAVGASIVVYGALDLSVPEYPLYPALAKGLTLRGYTLFEISGNDKRLAAGIEYISEKLASGSLQPVIDKVFPFSDFSKAHEYLEASEQFGKIVVEV